LDIRVASAALDFGVYCLDYLFWNNTRNFLNIIEAQCFGAALDEGVASLQSIDAATQISLRNVDERVQHLWR